MSLLFWIGFSRNFGQNHCPRMQKVHFQFTCVDRSKTSLLKLSNNRSCCSDLRLGCMAIWRGGGGIRMGYLEWEWLLHKNRRSRILTSYTQLSVNFIPLKLPVLKRSGQIFFQGTSASLNKSRKLIRGDLGTDQQQHTCFPRRFNYLVKGVVK